MFPLKVLSKYAMTTFKLHTQASFYFQESFWKMFWYTSCWTEIKLQFIRMKILLTHSTTWETHWLTLMSWKTSLFDNPLTIKWYKGLCMNDFGKILRDATLPLLVAAATFQIQQREFEGFENGNWWSNLWLLLYDLRQEATWLLKGNKRNSSCSSHLRSFQAGCLNINWFLIGTNLSS